MKQEGIIAFLKKNIVRELSKIKISELKMIPNILSLTRIGMVPVIMASYIVGISNPVFMKIAVALFGCSAITDMLDGQIARKFHLQSTTGAVLDAFADKFLLLSMIPMLFFHPSPIIKLLLGMSAVNESLIAGMNLYGSYHNCHVASSQVGKIKTWFLFLTLGGAILSNVISSTMIPTILLGITNIGLEYQTFKNYRTQYLSEIQTQREETLKEKEFLIEDKEEEEEKELTKQITYNQFSNIHTTEKSKYKKIGSKNKLHQS